MKTALVGVIGHVDHGKTALVRALTSVETDRLPEERAREISIVLGFAPLRLPGIEIDLIDMPGHERFVHTMVAGATGIDGVLLVVAGNEGIKPQTLEHLEIARLIGVRRGVAVVTKCDLLDDAEISARIEEVSVLAASFGLADIRVLPVSALTGRGLEAAVQALAALADASEARADDGFAYLPVDRAFVVDGIGPVVTGTLRRGALQVGDAVEIGPGRVAQVRSLQIHGRSVLAAPPGRRTAVALRGVARADLRPGLALATPGILASSHWLDVAVAAAVAAPGALPNGMRLRLLVGTADTPVKLRLLDREHLAPGETALAQIQCPDAVVAPAREPFVLRRESPATTVGGGRILDPVARRLRRYDPVLLARLELMASGRPTEVIRARLGASGVAGASVIDLARSVGVAPARVERRLAEIGAMPLKGARVVASDVWSELETATLALLAGHHRKHPLESGLSRTDLVRYLPTGADPTIVDGLLAHLIETRALVQERGLLRLFDFDPAAHDDPLTRELEAALRQGGLTPPDEADLVGTDPRRREALRHLLGHEVVVRARDRVQNRSVLFHRDAIEVAKTCLTAAFGAGSGFRAGEAGAVLGISRKFSIPLLEQLDACRFTRRIGDRRVIGPASPADIASPAEASLDSTADGSSTRSSSNDRPGPGPSGLRVP